MAAGGALRQWAGGQISDAAFRQRVRFAVDVVFAAGASPESAAALQAPLRRTAGRRSRLTRTSVWLRRRPGRPPRRGLPSVTQTLLPCSCSHGGGQTRHAWQATATSLADAGWHAITVDLRGHGESTHPQPPAYALEDFVADVRALIAAIADAPIVIGASLGGIASLLAITESPPAPIAGLVLVDVAHRFQPRGGGQDRRASWRITPTALPRSREAADAVAAYLPHRERPHDTDGLRHNLRC